MSTWSNAGNVTLGALIRYLESLPPDQSVAEGFGHPHSYRGYYEDLAFEPVSGTTVQEMLDAARSAFGKTFHGYKGGEFVMGENTDCWLAPYGTTGIPIVLPGDDAVYVLPAASTSTAGKEGE